jgi:hypothetical protein
MPKLVMRLLLRRRLSFFFKASQIINTVKSFPKTVLLYICGFFINVTFLFLRIFSMWHFTCISMLSYFLKRLRRMLGMQISTVGEGAE